MEEHHRNCNIAKTAGAAAAVIGGAAALATGGALLPAAVAAAGSCVSVGTTITDISKSKEFNKKIRNIASSQKAKGDRLKKKLEELKEVATKARIPLVDVVRALKDGTLYALCGTGALVVTQAAEMATVQTSASLFAGMTSSPDCLQVSGRSRKQLQLLIRACLRLWVE